MQEYAMTYCCPDGTYEADCFKGDWFALQEFIRQLRNEGYTDISAAAIYDEACVEEDEDFSEDWEDNCDDDCGYDPYMGCFTDDC